MSEVEKFVLSYEVDSKDAIGDVEDLQKRVDALSDSDKTKFKLEADVEQAEERIKELQDRLKKLPPEKRVPVKVELAKAQEDLAKAQKKLGDFTGTGGKKTAELGKKLKEFGGEASKAVSGIAPEIAGMSAAMGELAAATGPAVLAFAALGIGIKGAMDVRERFTANMKIGQTLGVSPVFAEEYRRVANTEGGGMVNDKQFVEQLQGLREKISGAVTDVTGFGTEARAFMKGFGLKPRELMNMRSSDQIAVIAQKMQENKGRFSAQAVGRYLGLDPNTISLMQKRGNSLGKITKMSSDEVKGYLDTQDKVKDFNKALGELKNSFDLLEQKAVTPLIQVMTALVNVVNDVVDGMTKMSKPQSEIDKHEALIKERESKLSPEQRRAALAEADKSGFSKWIVDKFGLKTAGKEALKDENVQKYLEARKMTSAEAAKQYDVAHGGVDTTKSAQVQKEAADKDRETATALAHANDENNEAERINQDKFARAMNMFVGAVASFANATDEQQAIAAWAGEVGRAGGLGGPTAAAQGAVAVPADAVPTGGVGSGDVIRVTGKGGKPHYLVGGGVKGGELQEFTGKPTGETRANMQMRDVMANVSQRTGVGLDQVAYGQISKGDVNFTLSQRERELRNAITAGNIQLAKAKASGMVPELQLDKIRKQIAEARMGLVRMHQWGGVPSGRAREGDRQYTKGERQVIVNVSGTFTDPEEAGKAAGSAAAKEYEKHLTDLHNTSATLYKR
jgi:hypothetical protein